MKIRVCSDIHTECLTKHYNKLEKFIDMMILPPMDTDKETVLILAGDIGSMQYAKHMLKFIDIVCARFLTVVWVPGNHEHWGASLQDCTKDLFEMTRQHGNLIVDNFEKVPIDYLVKHSIQHDNDLWMATLWCGYRDNPLYMQQASESSNDYRNIYGFDGETYATPEEVVSVHKYMVKQLEENVKLGDIIVSHHPPSALSAHDASHKDIALYCNNLEEFILEKNPILWVHGHTHNSADYYIGNTRIICNPFGYHGYEINKDYNPELLIEL